MRPFKNVDVLAITCLLAGVAILTQVRQSPIVRYQSARLVEFTQRQFLPVLTNPHMPKLCLTRD
ncbi:MAG TPA: hypothetical protein VH477_03565 [Bryobacteraceae bacterium]|jgi:hypothetical protein